MAERLPQNEQSIQDSRQGVSATFYKIMVTATIQVDMYNVTRRVVENWVWHKATNLELGVAQSYKFVVLCHTQFSTTLLVALFLLHH